LVFNLGMCSVAINLSSSNVIRFKGALPM
jgi:hypothetical protein